eukprot:COSAG01_NODE_436_length_17063_cov_42.157628_10_plen_145_part_00
MRTRCARVVFVHLILAVGIVRSLSHPAVVNDIVMQLLSGAAVPQKRIHCETCRSCRGHLRRACNFTDGVQVQHKSHVRHENQGSPPEAHHNGDRDQRDDNGDHGEVRRPRHSCRLQHRSHPDRCQSTVAAPFVLDPDPALDQLH